MKKILFSRSHKKHYSDTVVRVGKNNLGFSLVELIVIIAIMAILAGIAIPVLGVFIEKAKKSNDVNLISDIIYAIEIGNKAGSYTDESSFAIGDVTVPIGFIVLSQDGVKVVASSTERIESVDGNCEFITNTIRYVTDVKGKAECINGKNHGKVEYYAGHEETVTYCKTHSAVYEATGTSVYPTELRCEGTLSEEGCDSKCEPNWVTVNSFTVEEGTLTVNSDARDQVFGEQTGTGMCQKAYACQNGSYRDPQIVVAGEGDLLYDTLIDVFGDELNSLALSYDGWVSGEGVDHATIYSGIAGVFSEIEGYSDMLLFAKKLASLANKGHLIDQHLSGNYIDSEDMLEAFSDYIAVKFPPDQNGYSTAWDQVWANAANGGIGYNYGLPEVDQSHLDFIYGMAVSYNRGFATYCTANGLPQQYVEQIDDFKTPLGTSISDALDGLEIIPRTVNYGAFNGETVGSGRTLQKRFIDAGDTTGEYFTKCKELYTAYINSEACKENGRAVYSMLVSVNETKDVANAYNELNGGNLFDYYDSYLQEMSALYSKAEEEAGDGIIIIVTAKNGVLEYQVSPAAADPRNKS